MKSIKPDLKAITKELKALITKTERLMKAVDKLEKAVTAKPKATSKAKTAKKKPARKAAAKKKTTRKGAMTATDKILSIINRSKKGVDVSALMKKSGFDEKKVRNIVARAYKQKKIKRNGRGIYIGA